MQTPVKIYLENAGHYIPRNPTIPADLRDVRLRLGDMVCGVDDIRDVLRSPNVTPETVSKELVQLLWDIFEVCVLLGINTEPEWNNFTATKLGEIKPPPPTPL